MKIITCLNCFKIFPMYKSIVKMNQTKNLKEFLKNLTDIRLKNNLSTMRIKSYDTVIKIRLSIHDLTRSYLYSKQIRTLFVYTA